MSSNYSNGDHDDGRRSDLAVMDSNEYKNKRRLERILDALDNIPEQADRAREQYNAGEIDIHARRIAEQDAVQDAIWEAWNLLADHEDEQTQRARTAMVEYLDEQSEDADISPDELTVDVLETEWRKTGVWPHSKYFIGHPEEGPLGRIPRLHGDDNIVWGLHDYYHLQEFQREQWTEQEKPRNCAPRVVEREQIHTVPRELTRTAALRLKEFLNREHDMEIQFEALPGGEAKFDYSDIIDAPTEGFDE